MHLEAIALPDAHLAIDRAWLGRDEADAALGALQEQIRWEVHRIRLFGRDVDSPRLSCWIGDPGASYRYSRTRFEPHPWPRVVAGLRARLETALATRFDSVLANLYRDGDDSMGWHSDDEPELGPAPLIASLSFGATRRFTLKHRSGLRQRHALELPHGSLLLMSGTTQLHWKHALPRTARPCGVRINLTFRRVLNPADATAASTPRH